MKIIGSGSALPEQVVTNDDLSRILDTSDEWIVSHTGIRERHIIKEETLAELATAAAQRALQDAGLTADQLDLIICTSVLSDCVTPGSACFVAGGIGYHGKTLDVNGACTGFIKALDVADAYFAAGKAQRILLVAAAKPSFLADWNDRSTCVLFGDGAGAAVVEWRQRRLPVHARTGLQQPLHRAGEDRQTQHERPGGLPLCGVLVRE